ncbi:hypothetical protein KHP62_05370 [Rhodobacteraceae bacterium NNCM2]|nr:hypothetical protein [Coraliihabitans acroporae]
MPFLLTIPAAIGLIGITGLIGAFWTARDLGRVDATAGILLVVYTLVIGGMISIGGPDSVLPGIPDLARVVPWVMGASLLIGLIAGCRKRG